MRQMTINWRVYLAGAAWSFITLLSGTFVYVNVDKQIHLQSEIEKSKETIRHFTNLLTITVDMETGIRGYLLSGEDVYLEPFTAAEGLFDAEARVTREFAGYDPEQLKRIDSIIATKKSWIEGPAVEEMMLRKKLTRGMIDSTAFIAGFKASKGKELTDHIRTNVQNAITQESKRTAELLASQQKSTVTTKNSSTFGVLFATLVGMGLLILTIRRLTSQMKDVVDSLQSQAQDLGVVSSELTDSSSSLSNANSESASALQETASAVAEISAMTASNASMAREAQTMSEACTTAAEKGNEAVSKVLESMNQTNERNAVIRSQFAENSAKLSEIVTRIREISTKTQVINEIVFQTKLLSFNASVEAARAGENGKGFAVVAEEVGSLANMSGNAAKEITDLLKANEAIVTQTIQETTDILESMVSSIEERVRDGVQKSEECHIVFGEIQQKISAIQSVAGQISSSSAEQAKGVEDISKSIAQIGKNVQTNAQMAVNSSDIAKDLQVTSGNLDLKVLTMRSLFERVEKVSAPKDKSVEVSGEDTSKAA